MKLLILLFLLQISAVKINKTEIIIQNTHYTVTEKKTLYKDTLYYCKGDVVFRRHDTILYYYKQGEYKKFKI